ncbi:MAG: hypothetical protein KDC66_19160 [Phaeodactylibacter sp.]|nr:hypothetical protein [Phaeodactylibacter sp.]
MIWDELAKIALIGTERARLSESTLLALARLGIDTDGHPAQVVLEAAALYHGLRRAGFPLSKEEQPVGLPGQDAIAGGRPASARASRHLSLILDGHYWHALPEYLELAGRHRRQLPAEYLPALFQLSLKYPEIWSMVQPALGPAGQWLLRQNPDWQPLSENPEADTWPDASLEDKQAMLRFLRRTSPEHAPPLLRPIWDGLSYTDKLAMLNILARGLGDHDEEFLEHCLLDSRREVRQAAAGLLSHMPDSGLVERLFARAKGLLKEADGAPLELLYPKELDEGLKRDGIGAKKGTPATWAQEIISKIPPKRWEEHFRKPTVDCLRLLAGSARKKILIEAVTQAAILHQDHRWIEAIVRFWWRTNDEEAWSSALGKRLIGQLPAPVFNELAVQQLRQQPGYIEERSLLSHMLSQGAHPWEARLAQLVLNGFQQWISGARNYYWNLWHYRRILEVAAYQAEPGIEERFRTGWDARSPVWYRWEKEVERFLKVLVFRKEVQAEIARGAG